MSKRPCLVGQEGSRVEAAAPAAGGVRIEALLDPARFPHAVRAVRLIETHISYVVLTGRFAYKIKKPVNLDFADFSTLAKREAACRKELEVNRLFSPDLYLDVVPITGSRADPRFGGGGIPIEYAVMMVEFPQESRLDRVVERNDLSRQQVRDLARLIARAHQRSPRAPREGPYGAPDAVAGRVWASLDAVSLPGWSKRWLRRWFAEQAERLRGPMEHRRRTGRVRACHGDLHLANIVAWGGKLHLFDAIEFNDDFRFIDTMSDLAFLTMDLEHRGAPRLARHLLNLYLEETGDYEGLLLLPFYQGYRALVRAKVHSIRARQEASLSEKARHTSLVISYWRHAVHLTRRGAPFLAVTTGLPGSGKSSFAMRVCEEVGAVRLRSDVERKRLHGLSPSLPTPDDLKPAVYSPSSTAAVYDRLSSLARLVVRAGYPVVVDAALLSYDARRRFAALAKELSVPFLILALSAPEGTLVERLRRRRGDASDADVQVLVRMKARRQPLREAETARAFYVREDEGEVKRALTWLKAISRRRAHAPCDHCLEALMRRYMR